MDKKIVGVFKTEASAVQAINSLKMNGYSGDEISVIARQKDNLDRIENETGVHTKGAVTGAVTRAVTGAVTGVITGVVAGGIFGGIGALLLELGYLTIPGVSPFFTAGPITATLTGFVAGGAVGGIAGTLIGVSLSNTKIKEYENYLNEGNILVIVDGKDNRNSIYENFNENESLIRNRYKRK